MVRQLMTVCARIRLDGICLLNLHLGGLCLRAERELVSVRTNGLCVFQTGCSAVNGVTPANNVSRYVVSTCMQLFEIHVRAAPATHLRCQQVSDLVTKLDGPSPVGHPGLSRSEQAGTLR